jgi:hypothetical protein
MYFDPETNIPFYVGKGCDHRYRDVGSRKYNKHLYNKIQKLRKEKKLTVEKFTKFLFENLSSEEALQHEIRLIKTFGRKISNEGPLLNITEGGDGVINPPNKIQGIIDDKETLLVLSKTLSLKALANHYKCSVSTISKACKKTNILLPRGRKDLNEDEVISYYNKTMSIPLTSRFFNCDRDVILRILNNNNIECTDGRLTSTLRGGLGQCIIAEKVSDVLELYNCGNSVNFIANQFDVDNSVINRILKHNNTI